MNRKILIIVGFILLLCNRSMAQNQNPGIQLANHIADKMKDTLNLNNQKRNQVFAINVFLHNRKMIIRQNTTNPDSLRTRLQREERKRDSLYQQILPPAKYQVYLEKKRNLISSN